LNDTCFRYIPLPGFEVVGEDVVEITICDDGEVNCKTIFGIIVVGSCGDNNPPNAQNDFGTTDAGMSITIDLFDNDFDIEDGSNIVFNLSAGDGQPNNGTVTFNPDGTVIYTPNAGFVGFDSFSYTIVDSDGSVDQAFVTIAVTDVVSCNPDYTVCREPFSAANVTPSYLCVDFCIDGAVIQEDGLHPTFFECSLEIDELNPTCFTYLPLPGFIGNEIVEVIGCNAAGVCDTAYIGVNTTNDIGNCIEIGTPGLGGKPAEEVDNAEAALSAVEMPNIITPNGDGINDVLTLKNTELLPAESRLNLMIFDQNGQVAYEGEAFQNGIQWDGKLGNAGSTAPEGTYFYNMYVEMPDGTNATKTGFIELRK